MGFAQTEREWAERAAKHLKVELKRAEITYDRAFLSGEPSLYRQKQRSLGGNLRGYGCETAHAWRRFQFFFTRQRET